MSKKLELRYERTWYQEPPKPETGAYKFRVESVKAVSDRLPHWPGACGEDQFYEYELDEPETTPEYSGKLDDSHALCLKDINAAVEKLGLDPKNIFLTGSMAEDYLCVEVVHIKKQSEQEQLEDYKEQIAAWAKKQRLNKEQELKRIQWQIESLQRQAENLKKK